MLKCTATRTLPNILTPLTSCPASSSAKSGATLSAPCSGTPSCKHLRTLVLKDLAISRDVFQPFWRACHLVERLVLDCATVHADKSAHRWHRKRLARLKHIVLKGNSSVLNGGDEMAQEGGGSELQIASTTSSSSDPAGTEHDHHLQGLVPGKRIREFQCVNLPRPLDAGDLHKILSNMDALEKLYVRQLGRRLDTPHELAALSQHMETLVELDIWGCALEQCMLVSFLEQCPRLQVFVADSIRVLAAAQRFAGAPGSIPHGRRSESFL
ncbi:hypothetical protein BGZ81_008635 [Podila clonocystis]|nr:hypothetical protein BGZ81_008635 [Podila clonocystis]